MSAACTCPDLQPIETIPTEPLKCACCGEPLELTCPKKCGKQHVAAALRMPARTAPLHRVAPPELEHAPYDRGKAPMRCVGCGAEMQRKRGRPPKEPRCERCTP